MQVQQKGNSLVITLPLFSEPRLSKKGATRLVASSGGNVLTPVTVDGHAVKIGVNAFIPLG
jgi:hypothetical protein